MADLGGNFDSNDSPLEKRAPWGIIWAVAIALGFIWLVIWIAREKKDDEARQSVIKAFDKGLTDQEEVIRIEREKLNDFTRRIEMLRTTIQLGQVKNGQKAVAEFNQLAAEQRAEREKYKKMAEDYNQQVAKFRNMQP